MEGVFVRGDVVLELVVSPAVRAELVLEVVRDGGGGGEGWLPVGGRREDRSVGRYGRCVRMVRRRDWMLVL